MGSQFYYFIHIGPNWGLPLNVRYKPDIRVNISLQLRKCPTVAKGKTKLELTSCIIKGYVHKNQTQLYV